MRKIENFWEKILFLCILTIVVLISTVTICPFKRFLDIPCLACGMSRAIKELLSFDFKAAFLAHPMVYFSPLVLLYYLFDARLFKRRLIDIIILSLLAGGFIAVWILKLCGVLIY